MGQISCTRHKTGYSAAYLALSNHIFLFLYTATRNYE